MCVSSVPIHSRSVKYQNFVFFLEGKMSLSISYFQFFFHYLHLFGEVFCVCKKNKRKKKTIKDNNIKQIDGGGGVDLLVR